MGADHLQDIQLLIFQATPFCNIDCKYCYLPNRSNTARIDPDLVRQTCEKVANSGFYQDSISVVWHAGEPLTVGPAYLSKLFDMCDPLASVAPRLTQHLQTNAMLIDGDFCDLFLESNARIGVSIDGPAHLHNRYRVGRNGNGSHEATMRGISMLRDRGIPFDVICVITSHSLEFAAEIYEFFSDIGAQSVGFNVDEIEGANSSSSMESIDYFLSLIHI